jgi:mono/diheme cytochrome c family protein
MASATRRFVPSASWRLGVLCLFLSTPLLAQGQGKYSTCSACHQANGQGIPGAFPPLAGSEYATAAPPLPIRIVLLGAQGPLTVKGQRFNSTMPSWASFTDAEIAATLTYVRSQWGNAASVVTAEQVAAERRALAGRTRALTGAEIEAMRRGG